MQMGIMSSGTRQHHASRQAGGIGADIGIARAVLDRMRAEAEAAAPRECCGILLGEGNEIRDLIPAANIADDPVRLFEIDPAVLIAAHRAARADGPAILGYYHSHPAGEPVPSAIDQAMAGRDGRIWALLGRHDIAFWRDGEGGFAPLSYCVSGG